MSILKIYIYLISESDKGLQNFKDTLSNGSCM